MTPDDRERFTRIIDFFKPGCLRTFVRCPNRCKGGKFKHLKQSDGSFPECPVCRGSGTVFRTDKEGRELIKTAVIKWYEANRYDEVILSHMMKDSPSSDWQTSLRIWDNRHGQPWEDDITKYVGDYADWPDDLETPEGCEQLKQMLKESDSYESMEITHSKSGVSVHLRWRMPVDGEQSVRVFVGEFEKEADAVVAATMAMIVGVELLRGGQSDRSTPPGSPTRKET